MQEEVQKELRRIKGVGKVLAQRLAEAGLDGLDKVAEAGEEGLRKIRGLNPRAIPSILEQARVLAGEAPEGPDERLHALRQISERLQQRVRELAGAIRERQPDKLSGKKGARLEKAMSRLLKGLERVRNQQGIRLKRAKKSLAKTGKRLEGLTEDGVKGLTRGLKKARRTLKRI